MHAMRTTPGTLRRFRSLEESRLPDTPVRLRHCRFREAGVEQAKVLIDGGVSPEATQREERAVGSDGST